MFEVELLMLVLPVGVVVVEVIILILFKELLGFILTELPGRRLLPLPAAAGPLNLLSTPPSTGDVLKPIGEVLPVAWWESAVPR